MMSAGWHEFTATVIIHTRVVQALSIVQLS